MRLNPNKLFRWLSIRTKLIIAFTSLSIIPLLLVGVYSVISNARALEEVAVENLRHDVLTIKEKAANFLSNAEADLWYIRDSYLFREFLEAYEHRRPQYARRLADVEKELLTFSESRRIYCQIRFVWHDGEELFRVETSREGSRVLPRELLRDSKEPYYRFLVSSLKLGQVAFSPAELIDSKGILIPVVSYALPVIKDGNELGILITNIFARELFKIVEGERHLEVQGKVVLVNEEGYFLYHSEKKKDWNKLLASREDENLWSEYPSEVAQEIVSGKTTTLSGGIDEMISFAPLFDHRSGLSHSYFIYEAVPQSIILQPVKSFALFYLGMMLLFLFGSIGLGFLATGQLAGPIRKLQEGAGIISKGKYSHRLRIETKDEIEQLAEQFNAMAESLEKHENEIQMHRRQLELMVKERTRELSEEKNKLQAILDNIPSAFVVLDGDLCIRSASAAFESITGYRFEDVRGRNCCEVFIQGGFCEKCLAKRALETQQIETHVDRCLAKGREEKYFEHITIPLKEDGQIGSLIEIITDVTKRKRFEEHLIQTEKLMAAGEMASIIAHEFRNSLTSVKMILQLQTESQRLGLSDKKSLAVALNSIEHMEGIVTELLNFARPKSMELRPESLNKLLNDTLIFAHPQIKKRKITVTKVLDPTLPEVFVDPSGLKEAFINVLLNAAQAIEAGDGAARRRAIRVVTKRIRLRTTLRDYAPVEVQPAENVHSIGSEIILRRGTECALIEVTDTGSGIDRKHLRRIFDPFFTTKTDGTGLGLPLVKRTINAHGGVVAVKSKKGVGTTFRIYLPLFDKRGSNG